jgi:hypothetical protein
MSPILGIWTSAQQGANAVGDYESIQTVTVGSGGASSISFTSIPSTYSHLQIRVIARSSSNPQVNLRFNSDSGSNYTEHQVGGNGTAASAYGAGSLNLMPQGPVASTTSVFAGFVIDILDYANTNKFKTIRGLNGYDQNGSGFIGLYSNLWRNTAAVSNIELLANVGSFAQYSSFALYGIK